MQSLLQMPPPLPPVPVVFSQYHGLLLRRCPFCTSPVRRYDVLESREVIGRMRALEDEVLGLRTQLEAFRNMVGIN